MRPRHLCRLLAWLCLVAAVGPCAACANLISAGGNPDAGNPDAGNPDGGGPQGGFITEPMPIISQFVPAFASGSQNITTGPEKANDDDPTTTWVSDKLPAWIAYDLSSKSAGQRLTILVAWYAPRTQDYINPSLPAYALLPEDYTLEVNSAAGGTAPPSNGWTTVATVAANNRSSREHLVALNGGNWVRMSITKATDPNNAGIDLDVHAANSGPSDTWLFMGDSITAISLSRAVSNLPALVHAAKPAYYPAIIGAGVGGTNTTTALAAIDDTMSLFPGKFVTLNYGTNDHPNEFQMEALVNKVLAADKIPVIPHMPWSDQRLTEGPQINAMIDALYAKYPQIVPGPDLWQAFLNRTDLIPPGDVHPNEAGRQELRQQWALAMINIYK